MFVIVTLDVGESGPDVQQRIMSPFVEQFQCGFQCFSHKKRTFQPSAEILSISLGGATMFDGIGENFEKFPKTDGKVCEHATSTIYGQNNKSSIRPF